MSHRTGQHAALGATAGLCLALLLQLAQGQAWALSVPPLQGRVNDRAGLLNPQAQRVLEQKLATYERQTGHQFALLVVASLEGDSLEDFSMRVVEAWKLGQAKHDDGLLLLIALKEHKIRIEVGYGLEGVIPDVLASRVIRNVLTPALRKNDTAGGLDAAFDILMKAGRGEKVSQPPRSTARRRGGPSMPVQLLLLLLFLGPVAWAQLFRRGRGRRWGRRGGYWGGGAGGMGWGGGGGSGGGGGFGGGGGGFGGGGASGGW